MLLRAIGPRKSFPTLVIALGLVLVLAFVSAASARQAFAAEPVVRAQVSSVYWEDGDPSTRILNVEWRFKNVGGEEAWESRIFFDCTNGVVYEPGQPHVSIGSPEPTHFYSLGPGESVVSATHFVVPTGVRRFSVTPTGDSVFDYEFFNGYPLYKGKTPNGTWTIRVP